MYIAMKPGLTIAITFFVLILAACSPTRPQAPQSTSGLDTDVPALVPTETPYPGPSGEIPQIQQLSTPYPETPTEAPLQPTLTPALWVADYVPAAVISHTLEQLGGEISITKDKNAASLLLDVDSKGSIQWVYALVAPFPTISDGVTQVDLRDAWEGDLDTGLFAGIPFLMDQGTFGIFSALWGAPASGSVQVIPADELLQAAWETQPSWAIIPFDELNPQWKVLEIDMRFPVPSEFEIEGVSPIQKAFDPESYPLTLRFALRGNVPPLTPISNYDPQKQTDIMLTGVTAMVRGTALTMERKGITYPGEDIVPLTTAVDFLHVNNEIPFTPDCPFPELYTEFLVFCSDPGYLELLEFIGTDLVEVSGDHFGDHGAEGTLFSLDLYDEVGLPYYGGGRNLEDGRKPLLTEHHGNKIAFLGCNAKGSHYYAPADEHTPGAVPCEAKGEA